ncbi:MAG: glycoside hydrolase 100 family protein [Dehalococcoidales bacterium]|nr:glycoside hydrolase 100 family protein [Dehalococcoidales bacterium]
MKAKQLEQIDKAKEAAIKVLLRNAHGPYRSLPRTAGWGYPEPYTRDLLISSLGIFVSGNERLLNSLRRVLVTLAKNQSRLGLIPGLVHDPDERATSDTTPLFILAVGLFRKFTGEDDFLEEAVKKAMTWMEYQSPSDRVLVAQLPTSDWRDEQWVLGFGLYVNTIVYSYLRLYGQFERADRLEEMTDRFTITGDVIHRHVHEGLVLRHKPYFATWSYKVYADERFDLLGNSLAILSGLAHPSRARQMISWIERECQALRQQGLLVLDLPPIFFPYIRPGDPDWHPRYQKFNNPGEYLNGGVWPFACGFYIAALVTSGRLRLAEKKLIALTELVSPSRDAEVDFGFNEWFRAQDGSPRGEDWQSWSAAMYLYAAASVEQGKTPFFDEIRAGCPSTGSAPALYLIQGRTVLL